MQSYKIGVDGGGTKTECVLLDATGAVVARHLAPGCNPSQHGPDQAKAILVEALRALRHGVASGPVSHTLLCMAGNQDFWAETAATLTDCGQVTTTDDSVPVLALATGRGPGLVIHAGTGSFIAARDPAGGVHYAGGLGWKIGDPGSGFDLGRRGIARALLALQAGPTGQTAESAAWAKILQAHTGLPGYSANSRFLYTDVSANAVIAGFAPRVLELAEANHADARLVLRQSLEELAAQADAVLRRLFPGTPGKLPCGASGRILNTPTAAAILQNLAAEKKWPVELRFITAAPIEGVQGMLRSLH